MRTKLRHLLLVTLENPYDPNSWSGTPFSIRTTLERHVERVSVRGAMKPRRGLLSVILRKLLGGKPPRYPLWMTRTGLKSFAADTQAALDELQPDALLCISSQRIIFLKQPSIPMFMFCDAPWLAWKQTYKDYDPTPLLGNRFAALEAEVARRCDGLVYSSEWARQEAVRLYGVSPSKVHAHPIGARWVPRVSSEEVTATIDARPTHRVDLLFVGKDWERKGGPLAIEIARGLNQFGRAAQAGLAPGFAVTLHLVGCQPSLAPADEIFVKRHGFLSPRDPGQAAILHDLFLSSHFLLVPTQAECYGLVFAEAQAFGLPPISCAVQAVPNIILDGQTGIVQPKADPASAYIARLLPLIADPAAYRRMAHAGRARYLGLLTWDHFITSLLDDIEACL